MTPGVNIAVDNDGGDQRYVTPRSAVMDRGADIVIVGRGVTRAPDMLQALSQYKHQAWQALADKYLL